MDSYRRITSVLGRSKGFRRLALVCSLLNCAADSGATSLPVLLPQGVVVAGPYDVETRVTFSKTGPEIVLMVRRLSLLVDLDHFSDLRGSDSSRLGGGDSSVPSSTSGDSVKWSRAIQQVKVAESEVVCKSSGSETRLKLEADILRGESGWLRGTVTMKGGPIDLKFSLSADITGALWTLQLERTEIDIAPVVELARGLLPQARKTLGATGKLALSGMASKGDKGVECDVDFELRDGTLSDPASAVEAKEISAKGRFEGPLLSPTKAEFFFSCSQSKMGDFRIDSIQAQARSLQKGALTVDATVNALGGVIRLEPSLVTLADLHPTLVLSITGVDAGQVLPLFPAAKTTGTGQLDGRIPLVITSGIPKFGEGKLQLRSGQTSKVIFDRPGLFTQAIPKWLPIHRLLKDVEEGRRPFDAYEMVVLLHPDGEVARRSAALHLVGKPEKALVPWKLTLDTDIIGPLEQVMSLGLNKNVHLEMK